jgi:hypothetical protein
VAARISIRQHQNADAAEIFGPLRRARLLDATPSLSALDVHARLRIALVLHRFVPEDCARAAEAG